MVVLMCCFLTLSTILFFFTVTGSADGIHGSDPRVVEMICATLASKFEEHGAVRLRSPLMRPRPESRPGGAGVGGPAEVINSRGTVLLLPEDLTASFARAVGRGGSATSHLKRYDIGRVYHKSFVGGHPREALEASFDIVNEDSGANGAHLEAEALMVVCQVVSAVSFSTGTFSLKKKVYLKNQDMHQLTHTLYFCMNRRREHSLWNSDEIPRLVSETDTHASCRFATRAIWSATEGHHTKSMSTDIHTSISAGAQITAE